MSVNENVIIDEKYVAENADFLKAVLEAKTLEEARHICDEYKIELPEEKWKEVEASFCGGVSNTEELSEEELCEVSGGIRGSNLLSALGGIAGLGATIAIGSPLGIAVACAWIGYHGYKAFT